jgi:hypothetical protein
LAQLLFMLQTAFSIWMLVDAIKRRSQFYWYVIIAVPFGEWVYFFMVKIHDFKWSKLSGLLGPRAPSLKQLRFEVQQTPSVLNKCRLADGLHDGGAFDEAFALYQEVLRQDDEHKGALYGAALCQLEQDEVQAAAEALAALVDRNPSYRDYEPWQQLVRALWASDQREQALDRLRQLNTIAPRVPHQIALGRYLAEAEDKDQARQVLQQAIEQHEHAPRHVQRAASGDVAEARRLLKSLG